LLFQRRQYILTAHGTSTSPYSSNLLDALDWSCRGGSHLSTFWIVINSIILWIHDKSKFCIVTSSISRETRRNNSTAFFDDQNSFCNQPQKDIPTLLENTQTSTQKWAQLIYGTKRRNHVINKTTSGPCSRHILQKEKVQNNTANLWKPTKDMDNCKKWSLSPNTKNNWSAWSNAIFRRMDISQTNNFKILLTLLSNKQWTQISNISLPKKRFLHYTRFFSHINHLLVPMTFTKRQWQSLESWLTATICKFLHLDRNFPRNLLHNNIGYKIFSLWTKQDITKLKFW